MTTTLVSAGCIRLYSTGPQWHINEEHSTFGLIDTSVQPYFDSSGFLQIDLLEVGPRAVGSMTAASDETLTGLGVLIGCSNGGPLVRMKFYKIGVGVLDLNNTSHYAMVDGGYSNLWLTLVHELYDA